MGSWSGKDSQVRRPKIVLRRLLSVMIIPNG
jgi:hypothetical protein